MKITSQISGLKDIQKRLKNLDDKVERKIARAAVGKSGTPILKEARLRAPVDSGALKKSLTKRARHRARDHFFSVVITVRGGVFRDEKQGNEVIRYYRFLELGAKHRPAQPFLNPALKSAQSTSVNTLKKELGSKIEQEARKS